MNIIERSLNKLIIICSAPASAVYSIIIICEFPHDYSSFTKRFVLFRRQNLFHILLQQLPGNHDLVSAALALEPEICAHPQNLPFPASTGMLFFQFKCITYIDFHIYISPRKNCNTMPINSLNRLLGVSPVLALAASPSTCRYPCFSASLSARNT